MHAARLHRARAARLLQEEGLFPGQEQVLSALAQEDGRTMGELAAILRVRPPTASKAVARLAAQGLVERRTADGDGRLVRVALTDDGRSRAASIDRIWKVLEKEAVEGLDGKDRKRLRKSLRRISRNLSGLTGASDAAADDIGPDDDDIE